jgi:hypothetical protein
VTKIFTHFTSLIPSKLNTYYQVQIKALVPYEHLHSDFQMLQKEQAKRRVAEPSVPPETADPQAGK